MEELKQHHDAVVLALRDVGWTAVESGSDFIIHLGEQVADLTAKLAKMQHECDEHVENLSRCKGNELAQQVAELTEQLAQAQAEIEDWRSKLQRALTA